MAQDCRTPDAIKASRDEKVGRYAELVKEQLALIGENPEREGLLKTPERVEKAIRFMTSGYETCVEDVVNGAIFAEENHENMVLVRDIEFYSMCEHHMVPFYGKAHVAYVPNGKVIGLSKIPRIVDVFARRLQLQERLTDQVAGALMDTLKPKGVGVVIEAYHLCMMMRGVEKQSSRTVTSSVHGLFRRDARTRDEFLQLVYGSNTSQRP
jgi:GTP cyclohydrolase I